MLCFDFSVTKLQIRKAENKNTMICITHLKHIQKSTR